MFSILTAFWSFTREFFALFCADFYPLVFCIQYNKNVFSNNQSRSKLNTINC